MWSRRHLCQQSVSAGRAGRGCSLLTVSPLPTQQALTPCTLWGAGCAPVCVRVSDACFMPHPPRVKFTREKKTHIPEKKQATSISNKNKNTTAAAATTTTTSLDACILYQIKFGRFQSGLTLSVLWYGETRHWYRAPTQATVLVE